MGDWVESPQLTDDEYAECFKCPMCNGSGVINALTDQSIIFVSSYADCPTCDGSGEI